MDKDSCRKEFYKVKTGGLIELSQFIPSPDPLGSFPSPVLASSLSWPRLPPILECELLPSQAPVRALTQPILAPLPGWARPHVGPVELHSSNLGSSRNLNHLQTFSQIQAHPVYESYHILHLGSPSNKTAGWGEIIFYFVVIKLFPPGTLHPALPTPGSSPLGQSSSPRTGPPPSSPRGLPAG